MSLADRFRRLFSSGSTPSPEEATAAEEDVAQMASTGQAAAGGMGPGRPGTPAAAEAAEAEIESESAPPDPNP